MAACRIPELQMVARS